QIDCVASLGRGVFLRHGATVTTVPLEGWRRASTSTVGDVRRLAGRPRAFGDATAVFAHRRARRLCPRRWLRPCAAVSALERCRPSTLSVNGSGWPPVAQGPPGRFSDQKILRHGKAAARREHIRRTVQLEQAKMSAAGRRWRRILFSSFEGWTKDYI